MERGKSLIVTYWVCAKVLTTFGGAKFWMK